jgi:hypothetical protein
MDIIAARKVTVKIDGRDVTLEEIQGMTDGEKRLVYLAESSKDATKRRAAQILIDAALQPAPDAHLEGQYDEQNGDVE